ncbi:carboxylesterase family protein [Arthrobacter sp. CJ23]|uniref:carboxylesterase family protein n=1 Tax=Arthrobacter sp. CJ23 TaxID=2972479 RepID=UPI00215D51E3|nr:carboxylesterase family protein [Arthrobacter sp. CJ23]UVJ41616.1 carboxylesterase family protein [Arthrobacter sp. CJ23]
MDAFGGTADSATLFGQSAGGDAIAHLMISDGAAGLFHRAIIQSAPLRLSRNRARMTRAMVRAAGPLPCDASAAELLELQTTAERAARRFALRGRMAFGTQYGQPPLPAEDQRDEAWRSVAPHIDVLIGSTSDETGLYVCVIPVLRKLTRIPPIGTLVRAEFARSGAPAISRHANKGIRFSQG